MAKNAFSLTCAAILKQARKAASLTQECAAEILDISVRSLQVIERGDRIPRLDVAAGMAKLYNISLDLFEEMVQLSDVPKKPRTSKKHGPQAVLQYVPVEMRCFSPELGRYSSYGLVVEKVSQTDRAIVAFAADISCNEAFVRRLAELCTRHQLAPEHLLSVIQDEL